MNNARESTLKCISGIRYYYLTVVVWKISPAPTIDILSLFLIEHIYLHY